MAHKYFLPDELSCPICRKKFIPAVYHRYLHNGSPVCTWSCLCEARRRELETPLKAAGKVHYSPEEKLAVALRVVRDGVKIQTAARETGCGWGSVRKWVDQYELGEFNSLMKEKKEWIK